MNGCFSLYLGAYYCKKKPAYTGLNSLARIICQKFYAKLKMPIHSISLLANSSHSSIELL